MSFLNSIFGNDELNEKIQELENSNLEMQKTIANLEIEKAKLNRSLHLKCWIWNLYKTDL